MIKRLIGLCLLLNLLVAGNTVSVAQSVTEQDTITANREKILSRPRVFLPDSLIRDTLKYEYVRIKNVAYKSSFTKELYKMIFVEPRRNRVNVMRTQNSEERFKAYAGKIIKEIHIEVLPPLWYKCI